MKEDEEKLFEELEKLAKPLQEWLLKNYDLMSNIILDPGFVKVVRSEIGVPLEIED